MTYHKMSRALRYYYSKKIITMDFVYQFCDVAFKGKHDSIVTCSTQVLHGSFTNNFKTNLYDAYNTFWCLAGYRESCNQR